MAKRYNRVLDIIKDITPETDMENFKDILITKYEEHISFLIELLTPKGKEAYVQFLAKTKEDT